MIGFLIPSMTSAFCALQAGAKARGTELSGMHLKNMAYIAYEGSVPPVVFHTSEPCAYCGVEDFAHNQCNRCGAVR